MSITKGQTFGVTEQITNTKLHNLVDLATISLQYSEFATGVLTSLASTTGRLPSWCIIPSLASGAAIRFNGTNGFYA